MPTRLRRVRAPLLWIVAAALLWPLSLLVAPYVPARERTTLERGETLWIYRTPDGDLAIAPARPKAGFIAAAQVAVERRRRGTWLLDRVIMKERRPSRKIIGGYIVGQPDEEPRRLEALLLTHAESRAALHRLIPGWTGAPVQTIRDPRGMRTHATELWALALVAAIAIAALLHAEQAITAATRRRRGLCPRCGYDRHASSGACPECGTT